MDSFKDVIVATTVEGVLALTFILVRPGCLDDDCEETACTLVDNPLMCEDEECSVCCPAMDTLKDGEDSESDEEDLSVVLALEET